MDGQLFLQRNDEEDIKVYKQKQKELFKLARPFLNRKKEDGVIPQEADEQN